MEQVSESSDDDLSDHEDGQVGVIINLYETMSLLYVPNTTTMQVYNVRS